MIYSPYVVQNPTWTGRTCLPSCANKSTFLVVRGVSTKPDGLPCVVICFPRVLFSEQWSSPKDILGDATHTC